MHEKQPVAIDGSLDGVVVAETALAFVDGRAGVALVRGYPLADLAARCTYEDVAYLVLHGDLPGAAARATFAQVCREAVPLAPEDHACIGAFSQRIHAADALTAAVVLADDPTARALRDPVLRATRVFARVPSVVAAVTGVAPPSPEESYASRALHALGGTAEDAAALRAFEVLLCLESEHGLSASTFACRVAGSSGADAGVSLSAAVATLTGPRHGGATAEAHAMLHEAAASGDPAGYTRARLAAGRRLPGFGHRIYKVADPRVPPLRDALRRMRHVPLLSVAETIQRTAEPQLAARGIQANIDLFGAVVLDALGVAPAQYVAAFAVGLASGWLAHWVEQRATGRLVRPESAYTGPAARAVP